MDFSYRVSYDLYDTFRHHRRCATVKKLLIECVESDKGLDTCREKFEKFKDKCDLRSPRGVFE